MTERPGRRSSRLKRLVARTSTPAHGLENGFARFAEEMKALERLGRENFAGLRADLGRHRIECDLEEPGTLDVAWSRTS